MTNNEQAPDSAKTDGILGDVIDPIGKVTTAIWWLVLIRGIFAVIFGIIALFAPLIAGFAVVFVFAAYALIEGIIEIVHAIRTRSSNSRWGWLLAMGIISVLAGLAAWIFPTAALLVYGSFGLALIAIYAVMTGIAGFPAAAHQVGGGRQVLGYIVSVLSIVLGVVLAIILLINPAEALINLIWVVGIWAVIIGVTLIVAAISARASRGSGATAAGPGSGAAPAQG